jgi:hypothetical protein
MFFIGLLLESARAPKDSRYDKRDLSEMSLQKSIDVLSRYNSLDIGLGE